MKLVFNHSELCDALGKTAEEFDRLRPGLEELGFPHTVQGLGECWSIMAVIRWVNGDGASMMAAHLMGEEGGEDSGPGG